MFEGSWRKSQLPFCFSKGMENKPSGELVTIAFLDMDFLVVELDLSRCSAEVKWPRQTSGKEYRRGLEVALQIVRELKRELRKNRSLLKA